MNEGISALLAKAEESLSAAQILATEGHHGFAASRAYYSMLYVAEALLASLGKAYSSHGGVIGAFGREFAKSGRLNAKLHRWLIDAQDIRNVGDYGVGRDVSAEQAKEVISQAQEFIAVGKDYLKNAKNKET